MAVSRVLVMVTLGSPTLIEVRFIYILFIFFFTL